MINLIACMGRNRVIGQDNRMPWHLPADLRHFKSLTMGHTIVMGRKTFQSIGKALPGRKNIILTRDEHFQAPGCEVVHSISELLQRMEEHKEEELFIIGGAEIYKQFMPYADRLYITKIEQTFEGDTFFPEIDQRWVIVEESSGVTDEQNPYTYSFITYVKSS